MTPLEINKKIAALKKLDWIESNTTNPALVDLDSFPTSSNFHPPKNWAESIQDAWQLFEEMIKNREHENVSLYVGNFYEDWICGEGDFEGVNGESASTAPLAICLAWIQWKENQ